MIIEKWKQSSAYVIGRSHLKFNEECQDRTYYASEDGIHVIALADGAGSKEKSQIGAEIVTKSICNLLIKDFYYVYMGLEKRGKKEKNYLEDVKVLKKYIINCLLKELETYKDATLNELSSTLLFFAIKDNNYIMGHIGDGVIGGLFEDNNDYYIQTLSEPHNADSPNVTYFVTDKNAFENLRLNCGEVNNLRGIILMSDGPAEVMYNNNVIVDEVIKIFTNFEKIQPTKYNKILSKFLSEKIAEYSSDDLSLNILYLESLYDKDINNKYLNNILKEIKSKEQIIFKSQYCVYLDSSIKPSKENFESIEDVRRFLQWI